MGVSSVADDMIIVIVTDSSEMITYKIAIREFNS